MGRHKKVEREVLQPKKPLQGKGLADWIFDTDDRSRLLEIKLNSYIRTYGLHSVHTSELEHAEMYERVYETAPQELAALSEVQNGGKSYVLRPELRASLFRAFIERKPQEGHVFSKWATVGHVYTKDAKGRVVPDFHFVAEIFGSFNHMAEVLLLSGFWYFLQDLGFQNLSLEVNNLGDTHCQTAYAAQLKDFLGSRRFDLCNNCVSLWSKNALEVLRCQNYECQAVVADAPVIFDFLDEATNKSFTSTLEALDELSIPYQLNHLYIAPEGVGRTTFVIRESPTRTVLCSGGYHDEYLRVLGGKNMRSFGFEVSLTNILAHMTQYEAPTELGVKYEVF
ncbi:MAG TPA: ATP phosphoribosyltransferase regulatory subunit, partial [Patescibacteria group bacterium]|nr:ATP phosphoribosyltransferase regulatory subunit [Patescibacteria group bacterium]